MIDIEKFICSLLADHPEGVAVRGDIHRALKEQGLEYKDGKIVPIEDKTELKESEDEKIRKAIHIYLDWLDGRKDYQPKGEYTIRDMIAWLEKKELEPPYKCEVGPHSKKGLEKQCEQKQTQRKDFISIPFGAFDSELIEETITIPDGCVATIEGNKIHIKKK